MELGEFNKFFAKIVYAKEPSDIMVSWVDYYNVSKDYKLLLSFDNYSNDNYPEGLSDILKQSKTDFVPYFYSENILFLDDEILKGMILNGSVNNIKLDYSIMLDTNYSSYIKKFVKKEKIPPISRETLNILLMNDFNYDSIFYLIENYNNLFLAPQTSFSIHNNNHIDLYENLYALELFKSIDSDKFKKNGEITFGISENEAKMNVDSIIDNIFKNSKEKIIFVDIYRNIMLLLIGIWQIQHQSKKSAKNKMKQLIKYMLEKTGIYYEREVIIAYYYFERSESVELLNSVNKGGSQEQLFKKIENIAWDFAFPRILELQISMNKERAYYIPFYLSHDQGFKDLISLFKIKGFMVHKNKTKFFPISVLNTTEFFEEKGLSEDIKYIFSPDVQKRKECVKNFNIENGFEIIEQEKNKLKEILES